MPLIEKNEKPELSSREDFLKKKKKRKTFSELLRKRKAVEITKTALTSSLPKIMYTLLFVLIAANIANQISAGNPSIRTEAALYHNLTEYISFSGVFIRNERVIQDKVSAGKVLTYAVPDGSKIAKGSVIAYYYSSEESLVASLISERCKKRIEILEEAARPENVPEISSAKNAASRYQSEILLSVSHNDFSNLLAFKNEYVAKLAQKSKAQGEGNFNYAIDTFTSKKNAADSIRTEILESVVSSESGYFVSSTDGYESILNFSSSEELYSISPELIRGIVLEQSKLKNQETKETDIGKLIDSYEWKLAAVIEAEKFDRPETMNFFSVGREVQCTINSGETPLPLVIEYSEKNDDGSVTVIFSCDMFFGDYVSYRTSESRAFISEETGLRISTSAIRFKKVGNTDIPGVFIQSGQRIAFRKINIIKNVGDFTIVEDSSGKSEEISKDEFIYYLSAYDTVITSGINLYEGRILR